MSVFSSDFKQYHLISLLAFVATIGFFSDARRKRGETETTMLVNLIYFPRHIINNHFEMNGKLFIS